MRQQNYMYLIARLSKGCLQTDKRRYKYQRTDKYPQKKDSKLLMR